MRPRCWLPRRRRRLASIDLKMLQSLHFLFLVFLCGLPVLARPALGGLSNPTISTAVYDELVVHFKYATSSYSSNCERPLKGHLVKEFSNSETSTHGFIARNDTTKEIVVAFRGSTDHKNAETLADIKLTNFVSHGVPSNTGGAQVHSGFLQAYNSVALDIITTIQAELSVSTFNEYKIVVVGHDIGGSLAALAAVAFRYVFTENTVNLYTYGQPRTGNLSWAFLVDQLLGFLSFRAVHTDDGVPKIIPESKGYRHHGVEYWNYRDPPAADHTKECVEDEDPNCSDSVKTDKVNEAHFRYFGIWFTDSFCH